MSKGHLAPLKQMTIPRLELAAAVTAVQVDELLRRDLDVPITRSVFWTDSQVVLAYIRNKNRRYKVFVANRVSTICQGSTPDQWHYVRGSENPADVLSRGSTVKDLPVTLSCGPTFLEQYQSQWDVNENKLEDLLDNDPEVYANEGESVCTNVVNPVEEEQPIDKLIHHYSSFYQLKKAVAGLIRVKSYLQGRGIRGPIRVSELEQAETIVVKHVQQKVYGKEIESVNQTGSVPKSSKVYKLSPSIDGGGLVVGGRLRHATLPRQAKYPVLLPRRHRLSELIVREYHGESHLGVEWTLCKIRDKYWIVNARALIKQIKHLCVTCKRLYATPLVQKMADLPPERCNPNEAPFTYVGVDLFGPFYVRQGRAEVKRYGCLYTCFTTRAIHIEKVNSLETDTFINGLVRFVARRGYPKTIRSDNGTNFVGAHAELTRELSRLNQNKVVAAARRRGIDWVFNPPHTSHQGGVWEQQIRTVRKVLLALLHPPHRMTDDIIYTVLCEVENIVNSRPITKVSDDVSDSKALTPNHLLILGSNDSLPWEASQVGEVYRKRWKQVQQVVNTFWKRWVKQYLVELQRRSKWLQRTRNVTKGDLVLGVDENCGCGT